MYRLVKTNNGYMLKDTQTGHVMEADMGLVAMLASKGAIENLRQMEGGSIMPAVAPGDCISRRITKAVLKFHEIYRQLTEIRAPYIEGVVESSLSSESYIRFVIKLWFDAPVTYGCIEHIAYDEDYNNRIAGWLDADNACLAKLFSHIGKQKNDGKPWWTDVDGNDGGKRIEISDMQILNYNYSDFLKLKPAFTITSKKLFAKPAEISEADYERTEFVYQEPETGIRLYCTTEGEILYIHYEEEMSVRRWYGKVSMVPDGGQADETDGAKPDALEDIVRKKMETAAAVAVLVEKNRDFLKSQDMDVTYSTFSNRWYIYRYDEKYSNYEYYLEFETVEEFANIIASEFEFYLEIQIGKEVEPPECEKDDLSDMICVDRDRDYIAELVEQLKIINSTELGRSTRFFSNLEAVISKTLPSTDETASVAVILVSGEGVRKLFHEGSREECLSICEQYGWEYTDENEFVWSMEIC